MKDEEFTAILNSESSKTGKTIQQFLEERATEASSLSEENKEFYLNLEEFIMRGGKRLRPIAFIMAYKGVNGRLDDKIYLPSISIELLHNATLVHDDIIDHDTMRRGGPTFHTKYTQLYTGIASDPADFGLSVGILGGNILFNLGVEAILKSDFENDRKLKALKLYTDGFREVVEGVFLESAMVIRRSSSEKEYLTMIRLKTSSLFEKGILMGATLAGANEKIIDALSTYAIRTGQAFQIQDDILGVFGVEEVTGKPSDSDIKEGKMTLLRIKLLEVCNHNERDKINKIYGNRNACEKDIEYLRKLLIEKNVLGYCQKLSATLSDEAINSLERVKGEFTSDAIEFFIKLSEFVINRKK
ncbi:MAG: polyprenyl synthetase family protein [Candidatus Odinarchaeum yellowstonii]|uniref:Polyprenyl synthetase family protein n=1 Tax=Odinarchaeota yellowstonii (strain LCB_4) TaxID=1841599 RepID=A0AAF0D314_ODILC|nr:MAG: polyprenyl synthetase family protein [Candidatus Odinarchaeum yellowstonii]